MVASAILAALPLAAVANAAVIEHYWNISYAQANPDGLFDRRVIGVNGSWPPPILYGTQGDRHVIHAYNGLGDTVTALHAHGMMFNGTNYWDGATGVTQCGIPAGETLDYEIDTSLNHGTYWIHGHFNGQYVDGLRSPNIVIPKNARSDNVTWDDEYTIIAGDWYHKQHQDMLDNEFMTWKNPTGAEPVPESALIYIAKGDKYVESNDDIMAGKGTNDNAVIAFEAGKTYRLRIINMAALAMFNVEVSDHDMYIIEVDGVETEPHLIETISISVAQRYSILVKAKNETSTNYGMTFSQDINMYDAVPDELILVNTVQIQYNKDAEAAPLAEFIDPDTVTPIDETKFVPLVVESSAPADIDYSIHAFFDTFDDGTNRASFTLEDGFQNSTYISPKVPSIFSGLSMGEDAFNTKVYGMQTNVVPLKHMDNVQLTVFNWDAGFHPFHLHGHVFQVLLKSFDVDSNDTSINPPLVDIQKNPMRRDTITIPPQGYVVLRFRADNPGAWFFHCHIDWHLSSGLAMVFMEAPDVMAKTLTVPAQMIDHCKAQNIPTTGNVVGRMSATDLKGEAKGPFPVVMGWTPKAIGALAGCIITFLIGFATIVWYGQGELNEEELEEEVRRDVEAKQNRVPLWKKVAGRS